MAEINLGGATLGNALSELLTCADIQPGDMPSYQVCKTIYSAHPLGAKIADFPIAMAQSQEKIIAIPKGPEERLKEAYDAEWAAIGADKHIFNCARLARIYGVASIAMLVDGKATDAEIDYAELYKAKIGFNVFDPLNTSGSLVLDQNPNNIDFQKVQGISVQGKRYHRSRTVSLLNEDPLYIEYTTSAFGYVGRSVYQRALFQLKSYINTLVTDDLISLKAGVLVAKIKQPSSAISRLAAGAMGQKREIVKEAQTGNVISISTEEDIEVLNLQNLDGAYGMARKNILENIASAASTPAKILLAETFAEGFGEGTEDAKHVAQFVDRIRIWMDPLYDYFEKIVRHRAWNPEFYATIQKEYPDYAGVDYNTAFYDWVNSFSSKWPSLLDDPESETDAEDVSLKALIAAVEVLEPMLDPDNKATLVQWFADNLNAKKILFSSPLLLDYEALRDYVPPQMQAPKEPEAPEPFSSRDSAVLKLPRHGR